jgi:hypothetical protein
MKQGRAGLDLSSRGCCDLDIIIFKHNLTCVCYLQQDWVAAIAGLTKYLYIL